MMHHTIRADVTALPLPDVVPTDAGKWCILRTAAPRTIALANSLAAAGYRVWTPRQKFLRKYPRCSKRYVLEAPVLPTFVLIDHAQLDDLRIMLAGPPHQHPPFSILTYRGSGPRFGQAPEITGADLDSLHREELRQFARYEGEVVAHKNRQRHHVAVGSSVSVKAAEAFTGLSGIVIACDGKSADINFGGLLSRVRVASWRALEIGLRAAA